MDIARVFTTRSESVFDFCQRGIGYYIPLYQREYSWDAENIDQLMEDVCSGVKDVVDGTRDPIHFMGTLILVTENNPVVNIKPLDQRALPERIDNVIDGQQRISTIAMLACQLYEKLHQVEKKLPEKDGFDGLREAANAYLKNLLEVFSLDLKRGVPNRKPTIIRASIDQWTLDGNDNNYKSEVSSYLASFIRAVHSKQDFPSVKGATSVRKNLQRIRQVLKDVGRVHLRSNEESSDTDFPPAWELVEKFPEVDLWSYPRPDLVSRIRNRGDSMTREENQICEIVQLFAFCHYLLQRCCFTLILPVSDVRAFDMFQSLNATGTPLTAFETFKPLVVNYTESCGSSFKGSVSESYLEPVDNLLSSTTSASAKNKLTNDFLTLVTLTNDGSKRSTQFSAQRSWLNSVYEKFSSSSDFGRTIYKNDLEYREEFIRRMGDIALFWTKVIKFNPITTPCISGLDNIADEDRKIATTCCLYLQKANHKMANTVLGRFYAQILRNKQGADKEFISACKIVAAFYTLWRSALPNTGLDEVYRKLLKEHISWEKGDTELTAKFISNYFKGILRDKNIGTNRQWLDKAKDSLRYDEAVTVCRFSLFVVSQDTVIDPSNPGLVVVGTTGSTPPYLTPERWVSDELKSLEHVAPQKPEYRPNWDSLLYADDDYQRIGNLTLLPTPINSSLSNRGWLEKFIYYQHLAETNQSRLNQLASEAQDNGVVLHPQTVNLLTSTPSKHHIAPIVQLGMAGEWNKDFVDRRSERICEILWDRLYGWFI
jgi:Protein of unknown function DUF262/Protein of unknown function (DUF1524)